MGKPSIMSGCRYFLLVFILHLTIALNAETVRLSFLNGEQALNETTQLLSTNGCRATGITAFQKAVKQYYATGFNLNLSKFPPAQSEIYSFQSTTQLLATLPHPLRLTEHAWDFNCYDTVIVASDGQLLVGSQPDDIAGIFLAPAITTNYSRINLPVATARDAFNFSVPAWSRVLEIIPPALADRRVSLTAALYSNYLLPVSTSEENLNRRFLQTVQASWKRQAITFPSSFEIVLCHTVWLPQQQCGTIHAGLLFTHQDGFTYLEKDSGNGPFVRLELKSKADLIEWLSSKIDRQKRDSGAYFLATFNDTRVERLRLEYD